MNNRDYIYLASPYNNEDEKVRIRRMNAVTALGFDLTSAGLNVFCPITQSFHLQNVPTGDYMEPYALRGPKLTHEEWMRVDLAFLSKAKVLVVYCLEGWDESKGVGEELDFAKENNITITYIVPEEVGFIEKVVTKIKVAMHVQDAREKRIQEALDIGKEQYKNALHGLAVNRDILTGPVAEQHNMHMSLGLPRAWKDGEALDEDLIPVEPDEIRSIDLGLPREIVEGDDDWDGSLDEKRDYTTEYNKLKEAKENPKGVKAIQAANKPTTLNFPWTGYDSGFQIHKDCEDRIGQNMARVIAETVTGKLKQNTLFLLERTFLEHTDMLQVNEVFVRGMEKHGLRTHLNYDKMDIELLVDALGRHILKGLDNLDEESGLPHVAHALANILMIRQTLRREQR